MDDDDDEFGDIEADEEDSVFVVGACDAVVAGDGVVNTPVGGLDDAAVAAGTSVVCVGG